jgi:AcrR family transcriptional regulator
MNDDLTTRDRLLVQARKLFSEKGLDRASVRAITRLAKANLGAVTYHFGSKQQLYQAVLEQLFSALGDRVTAAAATRGPAAQRLAAIVHALFAFFGEYPEAPRIMIRELAQSGTPPLAVLPFARRNLGAVIAVIREGQAAGELRPVEPMFAAFSLVSQSIWFAVFRHPLAVISGAPLESPEAAARVERHIAELVTRGLAPDGAPS